MPHAKSNTWTIPTLLIAALTFCSSPTRSPDPKIILEYLLSLPAIDLPPETEQNSFDTDYLLVKKKCQIMEDWRVAYNYWFQVLYDENVAAETQGDSIWWQLDLPDLNSVFTLAVAIDDTLSFYMNIEGPPFEPPGEWYASGWIDPTNGIGKTALGPIEYMEWKNRSYGSRIVGQFNQRYSIDDSTNGGGLLTITDTPLPSTLFRAHWDTNGHGWYWTPWESGEW